MSGCNFVYSCVSDKQKGWGIIEFGCIVYAGCSVKIV